MKILITGASGFIGSAFVRHVLQRRPAEFCLRCLVRNSNQRNLKRLYAFAFVRRAEQAGLLHCVHGDLLGDISGLCEGVDAVVHLAARTFVDHSIRDPLPFVEANVLGTYRLLEDARRHRVKRFIHVSTDEVYGANLTSSHTEEARINPTNPYAASKTGADALAISYAHAFGLHTTVTRTENNYGILQHPQKALPVFVKAACRDEPLPVYGHGRHVRQWLWVDDHVAGLLRLLECDYPPGEVFHIAGNQQLSNYELARWVLHLVGKPEDRIRLVPDQDVRPGHDRRYALVCDKLKKLGWRPEVDLAAGLERAVGWYVDNAWWLE
jgi:dTDP-glucose 4,6-dehydratase